MSLCLHAFAIYCNFMAAKMTILDEKVWYFFLIFAQNLDCGDLLELPHKKII